MNRIDRFTEGEQRSRAAAADKAAPDFGVGLSGCSIDDATRLTMTAVAPVSENTVPMLGTTDATSPGHATARSKQIATQAKR